MSALLLFLSLLALSVHCRDTAANRPPEDQEPGDDTDVGNVRVDDNDLGSTMGEESKATAHASAETDEPVSIEYSYTDKMRWITYSKRHGTVVRNATVYDAEDVIRRCGLRESSHQSQQCASGKELKSPMGILYELDDSDDDWDFEEMFESNSLPRTFKRVDTSQYPGFATGMLKSKNCTAFMIGRVSALTLAECVYDKTTGIWTQELNLWRGRNCNTFINHMKWETVTIPSLYFHSDDNDYNWAYIKYEESTPSENWIGLSFDCQLKNKEDVHVTLSGYQRLEEEYNDEINDTIALGCPYQCSCLLLASAQRTFCPSDSRFAFPGSPLVAAPANPHSHNYIGTSPRLYGIASGSIQSSINKVTLITEESFWLIHHLMEYNEDIPTCRIGQQEWFINRVLKTG